jgi:hypothetical protein
MSQARTTLSHTVSCCPLHTRSFHMDRLVQLELSLTSPRVISLHWRSQLVATAGSLRQLCPAACPTSTCCSGEVRSTAPACPQPKLGSLASSHGDLPRGISWCRSPLCGPVCPRALLPRKASRASVADPDLGSGIWCLFDPWIQDPE